MRVLALFGALTFGLSFGDPAGDHGRVGAGFESKRQRHWATPWECWPCIFLSQMPQWTRLLKM
ncbi:hypothetical protein ACL02O_33745 [Micromonospora sp. MS34]|uniref:hypothetical protein n=1 Tax=Micromonospora sp. MS34 TaxID=3385971 RepID=UPI0039A0378A